MKESFNGFERPSALPELYGDVHNLEQFEHPDYHRHFRFLTDEEVVGMAGRTVDRILDSGITTVVVAESGAVPFASVCSRVAEKRGIAIDWIPMKFPRDPVRDVSPVLMRFLTDAEKAGPVPARLSACCASVDGRDLIPQDPPTLPAVLKYTEQPVQDSAIGTIAGIMSETEISRILSRPFLYFDEYLDSGTTLRNAHVYFHLLTPDPQYRAGAYYANVTDPELYRNLAFCHYNRSTREECYDAGAYPYENRLDLTGYFYWNIPGRYEKIPIASFITGEPLAESDLPDRVKLFIRSHDLVSSVRKLSSIRPVAGSITEDHLVRFYLYLAEQDTDGGQPSATFLWELFELYGPIWSPLPDAYHLDYLEAFSCFLPQARQYDGYEDILRQWKIVRTHTISAIASICEQRRHTWQNRMEEAVRKAGK